MGTVVGEDVGSGVGSGESPQKPSEHKAAAGSTMPSPYSVSRPAAPLSTAVLVSAAVSSAGVEVSEALARTAAAAATYGVAIEVPEA